MNLATAQRLLGEYATAHGLKIEFAKTYAMIVHALLEDPSGSVLDIEIHRPLFLYTGSDTVMFFGVRGHEDFFSVNQDAELPAEVIAVFDAWAERRRQLALDEADSGAWMRRAVDALGDRGWTIENGSNYAVFRDTEDLDTACMEITLYDSNSIGFRCFAEDPVKKASFRDQMLDVIKNFDRTLSPTT